ncbi:MAG: signal recognition particle subunit SRP19/SEC65 family protein [Nitrososphaerota archaeon]
MLKKKGYVIWPAYFDASISRSLCRRVPLGLSVRNPRAEQIVEAARRLGWSAVIEPGSHPAFWWRKMGKVIVDPGKPMRKSEVIRALARIMKSGESR